MSYVDAIILAVILFFLVKGWLKGFFLEFFTFVGLLVGLVAAVQSYGVIAKIVVRYFPVPLPLVQVILFIIILVGIAFLFGGAGRVLKDKTEAMKVRHVDRSLGTLFGATKGLMICGLVLAFINKHPAGSGFRSLIRDGKEVTKIALGTAEWVIDLFGGF
jgi:membrane protein required for colicin V production